MAFLPSSPVAIGTAETVRVAPVIFFFTLSVVPLVVTGVFLVKGRYVGLTKPYRIIAFCASAFTLINV